MLCHTCLVFICSRPGILQRLCGNGHAPPVCKFEESVMEICPAPVCCGPCPNEQDSAGSLCIPLRLSAKVLCCILRIWVTCSAVVLLAARPCQYLFDPSTQLVFATRVRYPTTPCQHRSYSGVAGAEGSRRVANAMSSIKS